MVQRIRSPRNRAARAALAALGCAICVGFPPAEGQGALGISPTELDFGVLGAGGVSVAELTVTNGAAEARSVDVSVVGDDASWFSVHRTESGALDDAEKVDLIILEPDGSETVHVRAAVPSDAQAVVATASVRIVERAEDRTVLLGAEVPMRVTAVGEAEVRGSIVSVDVPAGVEAEPFEIRVRIANTGTTGFVASVDAAVSVADGAAAASATSSRRVLLPGEEADAALAFDAGLAAGSYDVTVHFVVGGERIDTIATDLAVQTSSTAESVDGSGESGDRGADNRGLILVGSLLLVAVMLGGAMLVASDEAGPLDPDDAGILLGRRRGASGRHSARTAEEAWPHRR